MQEIIPDTMGRDRRPIFLQDWWLATARQALARPYRELRVLRDGAVAGYLSCTLKRNRIGIRCWEPFDWCRVNEPVLNPQLSAGEKASVLRELLGQLPKNVSFEFVCGPSAQDLHLITEIAAEAGFTQRRETVFWQAPEMSRNVLQRVSKRCRQRVKKAAADLELMKLSADEFMRLYSANLKAARRRPYSQPDVAARLMTAAMNRRQPQARIWAVRKRNAPPDTPIDAAIACVWDNERYYYWLTTCSRFGQGGPEEKAHPYAVKYLLVQAIQDAGERGLIFDTDSGDTEGAAKQFLDLRFEHRAERIIFMRHTWNLRLYNRLKQRLADGVRPAAEPGTPSRLSDILKLPAWRQRGLSGFHNSAES